MPEVCSGTGAIFLVERNKQCSVVETNRVDCVRNGNASSIFINQISTWKRDLPPLKCSATVENKQVSFVETKLNDAKIVFKLQAEICFPFSKSFSNQSLENIHAIVFLTFLKLKPTQYQCYTPRSVFLFPSLFPINL